MVQYLIPPSPYSNKLGPTQSKEDTGLRVFCGGWGMFSSSDASGSSSGFQKQHYYYFFFGGGGGVQGLSYFGVLIHWPPTYGKSKMESIKLAYP